MAEVIKFQPNYENLETRRHGRAVDAGEIVSRCRFSKSKLYREIKAGNFAKPMKLGYRMSRWLESDIDDYLAKMDASRQAVSA